MGKRLRLTAGIAVGVVVLASAAGFWGVSQTVGGVLRVGAATAQNSGWPAPERPADIGYVGDPQAAYGYGFSEVSIETQLGPAPAWLVPAGNQAASRWAIVVHGIGGRRENGYRFLPVLHEAGLNTLIISYRNDAGAPASPDGLYGMGLTEWPDLEAAVAYAREQGATDVVIVAESMGGGITGEYLRHSTPTDDIVALVLDAPALDFSAIVIDQMTREGVPGALAPVLTAGGLVLSGMMLPFAVGEAVTTDVVAAFAGPIFLSHGDADRVVPVASSDALVAKRSAVTEYLRTGADHIQSWQEEPDRYDAALRDFLASVP